MRYHLEIPGVLECHFEGVRLAVGLYFLCFEAKGSAKKAFNPVQQVGNDWVIYPFSTHVIPLFSQNQKSINIEPLLCIAICIPY
ncbi:hypothetical protein P872_09350 [Rhodonellum psychrophilum GCM71 = DSM 17998]|uniref:Uncharacterized protein n=1 Tax=Rhodonellum psychrophilum GCM71 = DSM 17998 TaxID=1123057 RepID=U5BLR3_9BACT|nr:hypothetical protein P872_09350 [Rhodonellum psychrophilum GCM71 = DSM 17998]